MPSAAVVSDGAAGDDRLLAELVERVEGAGDGPAAREAYRHGFARLRARLEMYPAGGTPSAIFASAARTTTALSASCLPLGVAVAMHLYPLCVLQSMPLPLLSLARFQRAVLLRTIRRRALVLANAGGERARGSEHTVVARRDGDGIRVDGTFEYMSLATVADVVLFKAPLAGGAGTVLCAADLKGDSVRIGGWRFAGSMRLSDTSPVTFTGHRVPSGRYVVVADDGVVRCTSDYQRCWFQLLLADAYLARLDRLHRGWGLTRSAEHLMSLNELAQLRQYALRLLDDHTTGSGVEPLKDTTSAMKLRVSRMAQAAMGALGELAERTPAGAPRLRADAAELGYIRWQPTADEIILRSIGVPA
jgi:alkylation response protein AidB-like acyl-CoA dehydrogenase